MRCLVFKGRGTVHALDEESSTEFVRVAKCSWRTTTKWVGPASAVPARYPFHVPCAECFPEGLP